MLTCTSKLSASLIPRNSFVNEETKVHRIPLVFYAMPHVTCPVTSGMMILTLDAPPLLPVFRPFRRKCSKLPLFVLGPSLENRPCLQQDQ